MIYCLKWYSLSRIQKSRISIFGRFVKTDLLIGFSSWPRDKFAFDIEYKFKAQGCFFQFF
ncbi:hypothetical protein EAH81_06575 [Flavobacterium pectinovorum]|uniref:Uncharacterized protein n=1 Tax=Flavobacterium pectinovorum TaxID=29533 RepID=A0A502EW70_9FLAO|nr:hypothetical protein EAH81_06575 [Flavobacterium pectinovorum]